MYDGGRKGVDEGGMEGGWKQGTIEGEKGWMREKWREEGKGSKGMRGQERGRKNWREGRNE